MKKLISWNVNGLRACLGKNFMEFFDYVDADIFCLQETKIQEGQVDWNKEGYYAYWNYAEKKGYSGTAIFSKEKPLNVTYGIGIEEHDKEGRVITLEFDNYYMVTVYTPNSQNGLARLEYRMKWEDDFRNYLLNLKKNKPVIVTGDMNVAHKEIDLKNPKTNRKEAFKLSKQMMKGNKWKTFLLDVSFIVWNILSVFTLGLLNILYVNPYKATTNAELYVELRNIAKKEKYEYVQNLNDETIK